jgi:hypothetical protein
MQSTIDYLMDLVRSALRDVDDVSVPVSSIARRALHVARLRNDWEAQLWLNLEMTSVAKDQPVDPTSTATSNEVAAHFTEEELQEAGLRVINRFTHGARSMGVNMFHSKGISDTEVYVEGVEAQLQNLIDGYSGSPQRTEILNARVQLNHSLMQARSVLARWRNNIGDYLSRTERELLFGQVSSDIFERNRRWVDEQLALMAPRVLEQFAAAYRRNAENDAESRSHALTSCRRVLKTLADSLYPAEDQRVQCADGIERKLTDDMYINRLCEFVSRESGSTSAKVTRHTLEMLGNRLGAFNALSSKGVHDEVDRLEVDQCLIQTYLVVADILRIAARSQAIAA